MEKKELSSMSAKNEFVKSIYNWLQRTLKDLGNEQYSDCFTIEGSSIMCKLPSNFFHMYTIPADTKIEMKFISKKS